MSENIYKSRAMSPFAKLLCPCFRNCCKINNKMLQYVYDGFAVLQNCMLKLHT